MLTALPSKVAQPILDTFLAFRLKVSYASCGFMQIIKDDVIIIYTGDLRYKKKYFVVMNRRLKIRLNISLMT